MRRNPRQSWILDSMPWIPDSSYWIPILSRIPDFFLAVFWIPKPRIPDSTAKIARFPESGFLYMDWDIIVDATSGTYNALRASPPAKLQNRCCCLPHICNVLHLIDEHSVFLRSELFLSLILLDLNLLRCQEQRYLLSSQCWVQGFHLQCS